MPKPTKKELYEMLRDQIEHEDSLVNQRLNWLLLSQAFLFAAFTSILANDKSIYPVIVTWAPLGIAIAGILINFSSFLGLRAAYMSLRNLRETWYEINGEEKKGQRIFNGFPKLTWTGKPKAITTTTAITLIILTAWWLLAITIAPIQGTGWFVVAIILYLAAITFMIYATSRN